jgi:hypothetical protein
MEGNNLMSFETDLGGTEKAYYGVQYMYVSWPRAKFNASKVAESFETGATEGSLRINTTK